MKSGVIEIILRDAPLLTIDFGGDGELSEMFPWNSLAEWWGVTSSKTCTLTLDDGGGVMLDRSNIVAIKMFPTPTPPTIKGSSDGI